jgi:hypothetical protein
MVKTIAISGFVAPSYEKITVIQAQIHASVDTVGRIPLQSIPRNWHLECEYFRFISRNDLLKFKGVGAASRSRF